jgi:hypothetical protein
MGAGAPYALAPPCPFAALPLITSPTMPQRLAAQRRRRALASARAHSTRARPRARGCQQPLSRASLRLPLRGTREDAYPNGRALRGEGAEHQGRCENAPDDS